MAKQKKVVFDLENVLPIESIIRPTGDSKKKDKDHHRRPKNKQKKYRQS